MCIVKYRENFECLLLYSEKKKTLKEEDDFKAFNGIWCYYKAYQFTSNLLNHLLRKKGLLFILLYVH